MTPAMLYEHTDIPAGMTCSEYRRARAAAPSRRRRILGQAALVLLYPARWISYADDTEQAAPRPASISIYGSVAEPAANLSHGHGSALP